MMTSYLVEWIFVELLEDWVYKWLVLPNEHNQPYPNKYLISLMPGWNYFPIFFRPKSSPNTQNPELASSFHDELKAVYINHLVKPDEEQNGLTASDIMLGLEDQSQIILEAVRPSCSSSGLTRWLI